MNIITSSGYKDTRANVNKNVFSGGKIQLYTGTIVGDVAITDQVLLAEFELSNPFGVVFNGVFEAGVVIETLAIADGTVTWARVLDSTDVFVMSLDVGVTGSGAAIISNPVEIYAGGTVRINQLRLLEP